MIAGSAISVSFAVLAAVFFVAAKNAAKNGGAEAITDDTEARARKFAGFTGLAWICVAAATVAFIAALLTKWTAS
jgi:hypothetical protein